MRTLSRKGPKKSASFAVTEAPTPKKKSTSFAVTNASEPTRQRSSESQSSEPGSLKRQPTFRSFRRKLGASTMRLVGKAGASNANGMWTPLLEPDEIHRLIGETEAELMGLKGTLEATEGGGLSRQMGMIMIQKGWGPSQMMKAWDRNKDSIIQRVEFRSAIRQSLGLQSSNLEMCARAPPRPRVRAHAPAPPSPSTTSRSERRHASRAAALAHGANTVSPCAPACVRVSRVPHGIPDWLCGAWLGGRRHRRLAHTATPSSTSSTSTAAALWISRSSATRCAFCTTPSRRPTPSMTTPRRGQAEDGRTQMRAPNACPQCAPPMRAPHTSPLVPNMTTPSGAGLGRE